MSFHLDSWFFFNPVVTKLDKKIKNVGLQPAMNKIRQRCQTNIITYQLTPRLKHILKDKPTLVVANHPAESDVIALLASLEPRRDMFLIINAYFRGIGKNLDKHLIPVHVHHRNFNNLGLKLFRCFHHSKIYHQPVAHQININNINKAVSKINNGGLVIIFPAGGGFNKNWYPGIGHLIKGLKNPHQVNYVQVFIKNTSVIDYLRLIPGLGKLLPAWEIYFAQPEPLNNLHHLPPKQIAKDLRVAYFNWIQSLTPVNPLPKFSFTLPQKAYLLARSLILWFLAKPS